ncbi:MAG: hydrogen peroxide-inducible genes activator [Pseudomonadota bacterium]
MPTFKQLQYLIAVADAGRYTEAARRLSVAQSAISAQIDALETRLGVKLLERGRHGAHLTPAGEDTVRLGREALATVAQIEQLAGQQGRALGGLIRLGALVTIGPYLLPSVTPRLHTEYPDLRLFVREGAAQDLETRVLNGDLDAALATEPSGVAGLASDLLFTERLFIAMPTDDPLAKLGSLRPEDLKERDMLTLGERFRLGRLTLRLAEDGGAIVRADYEGTSLDALRQMTATGLGLTLVPELYVRSEIVGRSDVVAVRLDSRLMRRPVHLVWRKGARRAQDYETLARLIREASAALLEFE